MKNILYIDACINRSCSRTEQLAQAYLEKFRRDPACSLQTAVLEEMELKPLDTARLAEREKAIQTGDFSDELFAPARQFAAADEVVIAAPYWDLSFPSALKLYLEQVCVNGLTFRYSEKGIPCGLTGIKTAVYLTTSGGYINGRNFGFEYVKGLFSAIFTIGDIRFFSAEGLDIYGNDPGKILADAIKNLP